MLLLKRGSQEIHNWLWLASIVTGGELLGINIEISE